MTSNIRPETKHHRWLAATFYGVVLILLALPIFSVVVPPLGDYPNHLGRMHILATYGGSPALQANYAVSWKLTPYLAMDLIVPALTHFMSIYTAGRVFLCLCLMLFVAGTAAVHAALFGRFSPWPAASALFAYSYVFNLGFVNYLFGVGIWLLAFAGWIVLSRGPVKWRVILGTLLSLAVFFSHFFAFFGYLLCVGAYELGVWWYSPDRGLAALLRRAFAAGCAFVMPFAIFLSALKDQQGGITAYGKWAEKPTVLLSPTMFPGARFDLIILGFAVAVLAGGLWLRRLRLAPPMRVVLAVLGAVVILLPNWLSGVWGMDYRFPVVFVYLLIAGCTWLHMPGRTAIALGCAMVALLAANIISIVLAWRPIGAEYDEFRAALPILARGARILPFRDGAGADPSLQLGSFDIYAHMPALAVVERDVYLPTLFKNPMMPVEAAPRMKAIDTPYGHVVTLAQLVAGADPAKGAAMLGAPDPEGWRNYWGDWPRHYDYAIELHFGARPVLPAQLELLKSGKIFNIYRIRH